jgi:hypothetical protein
MTILGLFPPIDRPGLFVQDMSQVSAVGKLYSPALGLQWFEDEWVPTSGPDNFPDTDPHDPARYFHSPPCSQACYLFGGPSLVSCLAGCRRK